AGWAGSVRCAWSGSRGPAVTALGWPGTSPRPACGWWRPAGRTGRTGAGRASLGPLDAVSAAPAALSGRARGAPKGRDGQVEAIRALMVAKRTARAERVQTINQARALVLTGPDDIRARFAKHATDALVAELAALRPRPGSMVRYHTLLS